MEKLLKSCISGFLISFFAATVVWAVEGAWEKIGESDGIQGFCRNTPRCSIKEMKGIGIVNASVPVVEAVIRDVSAQLDYLYACKEACEVNTEDMKSSSDVGYMYNVIAMTFPVKDRDGVYRSGWTVDKATGTVYCHATGVKTSYKQSTNMVRIPLAEINWVLTPKGPDRTEVTYQVLIDPGGSLPSFMVNRFTKDSGIKTIAGVRKLITRDKYRNAKAVVTTTPHT
jgi:hypothetical protein